MNARKITKWVVAAAAVGFLAYIVYGVVQVRSERRAEQKGVKDKDAGRELKQVLKEIEGQRREVDEQFDAL